MEIQLDTQKWESSNSMCSIIYVKILEHLANEWHIESTSKWIRIGYYLHHLYGTIKRKELRRTLKSLVNYLPLRVQKRNKNYGEQDRRIGYTYLEQVLDWITKQLPFSEFVILVSS